MFAHVHSAVLRRCGSLLLAYLNFFFQAEDGIRDYKVTGVQTCALPILNATPLWANRHPLSQKRRRSSVIPSRCLPWYLARIQRISRPHVWLSTALKIALDTDRKSVV